MNSNLVKLSKFLSLILRHKPETIGTIQERGLVAGSRQHVHLSLDRTTAIKVGERHGKPVVLKIWANKMHLAGFEFFQSDNGVWLTKHVPTEYIVFPEK
jgi:putative RNA 2'-phosphotransferase